MVRHVTCTMFFLSVSRLPMILKKILKQWKHGIKCGTTEERERPIVSHFGEPRNQQAVFYLAALERQAVNVQDGTSSPTAAAKQKTSPVASALGELGQRAQSRFERIRERPVVITAARATMQIATAVT